MIDRKIQFLEQQIFEIKVILNSYNTYSIEEIHKMQNKRISLKKERYKLEKNKIRKEKLNKIFNI